MESLPAVIFFTTCLILFLTFSTYATIIWIQSQPKLKEILNDPNRHWSFKFVLYYGMSWALFLIAATFISFIVGMSYLIWMQL